MDNLKEQNEFKLVKILNKYFNDILLETLSECANEITQAGYVQLQAGEDGLAKNPYQKQLPDSQSELDGAKKRYEDDKKFYGEDADRSEYDTFREQFRIDSAMARAFKEGTIAQKALCDKEYRDKTREYIANFKATDNTAIDNTLEVCARYEMLLKWIEEVELPKAKREKEEAVREVGDKIRKFDKGEGWIELGEADLADIIKQTLEGLK